MVRSLRHFRGEADARREALTKAVALRRRTGSPKARGDSERFWWILKRRD